MRNVVMSGRDCGRVRQAARNLGMSACMDRRRISAGDLKANRAEHSHAWPAWIEGALEPAEVAAKPSQ